MSVIEEAKKGNILDIVEKVAINEGQDVTNILEGIAKGEIIIPINNRRKGKFTPLGIGKGLRTKINANIGTSEDYPDVGEELKKLQIARRFGADTIMDLSTGGNISSIRKAIINDSMMPLGTVPIYEAAIVARESRGDIIEMDAGIIFETIERHAQDGVDFITVHCGVTRSVLEELKKQGRVMDVVSRGGAFIIALMIHQDIENPLFQFFDRLLEIAKKYDITLSLGDGFRPGCLADATDKPQIEELIVLGNLAKIARENGVQVMIEGPGHIPIHEIDINVKIAKSMTDNAPFYVLGPIVTDIAPGYDDIVSAIGGAIAGAAGADFLCYVTPREHLGLPTINDVKEGVIASRIAAHAADIAKGVKKAIDWDLEMAVARKSLNWKKQIELAIDPEKAEQLRRERKGDIKETCTMCGQYCAMEIVSEYFSAPFKKC